MRRINDIFYSLQGEGYNTGRAAVFVRFAGCNLRCGFCDTEFDTFREMTDDEILADIQSVVTAERGLQTTDYGLQAIDYRLQTIDYRLQTIDYRLKTVDGRLLVVLTGGEPTLQVDEDFVDLLHRHGFEVAMESNGTRPASQNLDWLTVSPKILGVGLKIEGGGRLPDEVKVVFDEDTDPEAFLPPLSTLHLPPRLYLQPCDTGDAERNRIIINRCIDYIKKHPHWHLSLQTHKLVGFK